MHLTQHFTLEELIHSDYAIRHGISNYPSPAMITNLKTLAEYLELVRDLLKSPIIISSGYRGMELNRKIGGSTRSAHMSGLAADFIAPRFGTPKEIVSAIKDSDIRYDQLIYEGTWVHFSVDDRMRRETLTATFKNGKAKYSIFDA